MQLLENHVMETVTFFICIHMRICCRQRIKEILKAKKMYLENLSTIIVKNFIIIGLHFKYKIS